jgi:hypothetical protein
VAPISRECCSAVTLPLHGAANRRMTETLTV